MRHKRKPTVSIHKYQELEARHERREVYISELEAVMDTLDEEAGKAQDMIQKKDEQAKLDTTQIMLLQADIERAERLQAKTEREAKVSRELLRLIL